VTSTTTRCRIDVRVDADLFVLALDPHALHLSSTDVSTMRARTPRAAVIVHRLVTRRREHQLGGTRRAPATTTTTTTGCTARH
jgi:hypothetical protein